jgi:hypothetical protein
LFGICEFFITDKLQQDSNKGIYQIRDEHRRRCHFTESLRQLRQSSTILNNLPDVAVLELLSVGARNKSVNNSSATTYSVGVRRFLSFLRLTNQTLAGLIADKSVAKAILPYVTYLFVVEN